MGSIADCWVLLYACQMVMYLNIYKVYMPANVMTFLVEFKKLIEFDWLNPIKYYTWFKDNKFRLSDYLSGTEPLPFDNEDQTYSIIDELQFYVLLIMLFAFVCIIMWMCRHSIFWSRRTRHWFRDSLQVVKQTVFFNWTIRFITVMYMQLCITNFNQMRLWMNQSIYQGSYAKFFTVVICIVQVFILLFSVFLMIRGQLFLDYPGIFKKISNLYEGIHLYTDPRNIWYMPIFMLRRLMFVIIPLVARNHQWLQI
jgi:hypothetical protein